MHVQQSKSTPRLVLSILCCKVFRMSHIMQDQNICSVFVALPIANNQKSCKISQVDRRRKSLHHIVLLRLVNSNRQAFRESCPLRFENYTLRKSFSYKHLQRVFLFVPVTGTNTGTNESNILHRHRRWTASVF